MGFLDNTTVTVDAILTKKGREKLARDGDLVITQYAFADDDIDYGLYDVSHPNGSSYYGAVLENMPLLEAFTDETQVMRYKLFTADKDLDKLATIIGLSTTPETLELNTNGKDFTPATDGVSDDTYDFTLLNIDIATMTSESGNGSFTRDGRTQVIQGVKSVNLKATNLQQATSPVLKTVLFVTSRESGATASVVIQNNSTGQFS
jgi:hypothetical protein